MGAVRHLVARRGVINQDQIEIGGEGHLAAAEASHADYCERASGHPPMPPRELRLHGWQQRHERGFSDVGERPASCRAVEGTAKQLNTDLKAALTGPAAQ